MKPQSYAFAALISLLMGIDASAQCLTLPNATETQLEASNKIIEGKVVGQQSFIGPDGNIYTSNRIDVYRVFKGEVGFNVDVITEGGIHGDLMQVVTPSAQLSVGDYGVMILEEDPQRTMAALASAFYPVNERNGTVYGLPNVVHREVLYDMIARSVGSETIELRRIPSDVLNRPATEGRSVPEISSIHPLELTAGTRSVLTITGQGFGEVQGEGHVAFRNADDGGQSFVGLSAGPHYLSWSDTEIRLYVPSATLYNTAVAGTGSVRVITANGATAESNQLVRVEYAKSEVIFSQELNSTMLVGMHDGGYVYHVNQQLSAALNGLPMVEEAIMNWACNTGVNFSLSNDVLNNTSWAHDGINLIGFSTSGQLPSYLLGKTVTTFSGCGVAGVIQWNLIEIDILLNSDIDWWIGEELPLGSHFDLETAIVHELGHAHLLQHNNDLNSPMYFQLTQGAIRRTLYEPSIEGGSYVTDQGVAAAHTCGESHHVRADQSNCDLSLINGMNETNATLLNVFPNPFKDQVTVSGNWSNGSIFAMFDATGRQVLRGSLSAQDQTIDTGELPLGFYLLEVRDAERARTVRLIKN